ncbi:hypothetical protein FSP39_009024 [Pinctada imbricata]|uniref:Uncharacterized protein n=1 Tax=Pinctada imbricata TaxID=66713 RepID=A0AA89BUB1_PINIB|nr:hypothetical protein FSP39_009024 [Pinctada imbricata]
MKMLKYSFTKDDGTFSPTHIPTGTDSLMKDTIDVNVNPRSRAKMVMKRRARQKRGHDFHIFPPISNTPNNSRKDIMTPYINGDSDVPSYINALGISRVHDVSTPYVMHSNMSKRNMTSPMPQDENGTGIRKEHSRVSQMSHHNVVEVHKKIERSNSHEQVNKVHVGKVSPFIERKSRVDHHPHFRERKRIERQNTSTVQDTSSNDKNNKLQIQSNQMGLVQRTERHRTRDNRIGKTDEPFSIRKKIEQFRRWHEEQYKDKLKRLKEEVDIQYEVEHRKLQKSRLGESPGETDKSIDRHTNRQERKNYKREISAQHTSSTEHNGAEHLLGEHASSERTWHTWRDVNDSYAYNDVKKYIEDNELMNKEKEDWIQKWIVEVETALQSENSDDSSV